MNMLCKLIFKKRGIKSKKNRLKTQKQPYEAHKTVQIWMPLVFFFLYNKWSLEQCNFQGGRSMQTLNSKICTFFFFSFLPLSVFLYVWFIFFDIFCLFFFCLFSLLSSQDLKKKKEKKLPTV